jgi:magnesium transporter
MIRSFYYHGAEVPATDLNREQMRAALADAGGVLWVDMLAASPESAEQIFTRVFGFHPLTISDCLQGVRRPKLDDHGDYIFFVIYADDQSTPVEDVNTVELDVFLGPNFVVTYHALPLPVIDRLVERVMRDEFLMAFGADILAYEILRAITSDYRPTVDFLAAAIAGLEVEVLTVPTGNTLRRMHELRHDVLKVRRVLLLQQEVMNRLATSELRPIDARNRLYFRELADRLVQMVEVMDALRESVHSALQTHLSVVSNENSRLLRLVAAMVTILVPLTLLVVLYDAGLRAVPALSRPYADAAVVGVTLLVGILLALYFYRRGWQ